MTDGDEHAQLERRARGLFDDSVARLDGSTLSRLNQARQTAVAAASRRRSLLFRGWAPAGALAAAAVLAVALWIGRTEAPRTPAPLPDALEFVAQADDADLLGDDVEFYDWAIASDGEIG
jgi:hypothetical protein